jgi:hypothetical protein
MNPQRILIIMLSATLFIIGCNRPGNKYFTGTIQYSYTCTADSLNVDSITAIRPAKSFFRYDLQDYQSRFIGRDTVTYYYSGIRNKCISETNTQRNYACEDYSGVTDSVLSWKIYHTKEKVLGYACKILEMQKGSSWVKYHVSTDLLIAPATYHLHKAYNWDMYGTASGGGLILKSEHRFKRFTMHGIATEILKQQRKFRALQTTDGIFEQFCK